MTGDLIQEIEQRRTRNFLAPIFLLNDDIILRIFTMNSHEWCELYDWQPITTTRTSWVCHHWRLLCLSTPKLWRCINLDLRRSLIPEWQEEMLRRAPQSSIHLTCYCIVDRHEKIFACLLPRAQAFHGLIDRERWIALTNEVQRPGSGLQTLVLHGFHNSKFNLGVEQVHTHALPLKRFSLKAVKIAKLDFRLFANLSSLALDQTDIEAPELLNALMDMPGLAELSLMDAVYSVPLDLGISVALPKLTRLELGDSGDMPNLLTYLIIPAACIIRIQFDILPAYETVAPLVMSPQFTIGGNQSVFFDVDEWCLSLGNAPPGLHHSIPSHDFRQQYYMQHSSVTISRASNHSWAESLYECLALLFAPTGPFSSITTLQLAVSGLDIDFLPFPFKLFKEIKELFITFESLAILLPIVCLEHEDEILFPSLKKLGLIIKEEPPQLDGIIEFLKWRQEHSAGINTLGLCYFAMDGTLSSFLTVAQRNKLQSLEVNLALFHVINSRSLVKTSIVQHLVDSGDDHVYILAS